jgi:hypothetical protein
LKTCGRLSIGLPLPLPLTMARPRVASPAQLRKLPGTRHEGVKTPTTIRT